MLTAKENYLKCIRGEKPERVPLFPDDVNFYVPSIWDADPETNRDFFGVLWIDEPSGKMPDVIHPIMSDVTKWREMVTFPDLSKIDWEAETARFREHYDPDKIDLAMIHTSGPFLLPINMLGWEEGLVSLYTEPDELSAFIAAIVDFLIELASYIKKYINPQVMFSGDDMAAANGPMISQEIWANIYKPQFERIVDAVHGLGSYVEFHNCGNNGYLIEEFLGIGVDICQLPMPNDGLLADRQRFGNRLVITGGWDRISEAAKAGASEEMVRTSAREAVDRYGKDGALIFWDGGVIGNDEEAVNKKKWLYDEVRNYGTMVYSKE
jgi:uroporphyrinogen-III decarboxylase